MEFSSEFYTNYLVEDDDITEFEREQNKQRQQYEDKILTFVWMLFG